jgi:hypothetical protein
MIGSAVDHIWSWFQVSVFSPAAGPGAASLIEKETQKNEHRTFIFSNFNYESVYCSNQVKFHTSAAGKYRILNTDLSMEEGQQR